MFDGITEVLPLLILLLVIFSLFVNNMPIDFVINPYRLYNNPENKENPGGLHNQKILSISNIVLSITFFIIIFVLRKHKKSVNHDVSFFQKSMLKIIIVISLVYAVLWGIFSFEDYKFLKILKKNNYIRDIIIYDRKYALTYSLVSVFILLIMGIIYSRILISKDVTKNELYLYFTIFVISILFLYLRWDGFLDLVKDLTIEKKNEWVTEFKNSRPETLRTVITLLIFVILFTLEPYIKSYIENKPINESLLKIILSSIGFIFLNLFIIFENKKIYILFVKFYIIYTIYLIARGKYLDRKVDSKSITGP